MNTTFCTEPPVRTYQYNAYALGAISAWGSRTSSVVLNNFIYIESPSELKPGGHPVYFLPFIGPMTFSKLGFGPQLHFSTRSVDEFKSAIVSSIRNGYFVRVLVDEFYIPERWAYNKVHKIHDILVIAVAENLKSATIIGYCDDARYRPSSCPLDVMATAYQAVVERAGQNGFIAFKAVPSDEHSRIELPRIKYQLALFLASRPIEESVTSGVRTQASGKICGLSVFDIIPSYLSDLGCSGRIDQRLFSLLSEHAQLMSLRGKHIFHLLGLAEPEVFSAAVVEAKRLKFLALVPPRSRNAEIINRMIELGRNLQASTAAAAESLYSAIP